MDKEIVIYRGDEHRAKMEKQFFRKDVFAGVYCRAYKLLTEIEQEMGAYREEIEKNKNRLIRYQGMGNNIVIFCGGRGHGKTSVMQSFAKCLDGTYIEDRNSDDSDRLDFVSDIDIKRYEVVDSIDPSAMESEESILRVLISRLFFRLEEYIKSEECPSKDDKDFLQNKKDIVKLFEICYANISCIKSGKDADCDSDDLQKLSQMGSSAKLKENLHDLIEKYLTMKAGKKDCSDNKCRYLIVPIDDADLVTKKLFRLCEDIRNYLSIPNVIILMAVDYEQLLHAIYQKYLKQYRIMREIESDRHFCEECHKMAAKYLEKVFPVIHRIDLPRIDEMLAEGQEHIKFDYKLLNGGKKYISAFSDVDLSACNDLYEQLLKILYVRTGLFFGRRDQGVHPFMPHTLRELTHWVKLLYDLYEIDCDRDVYRKFQMSESMDEEALDKLRQNIQTIRQYFANYWCEKNLDASVAQIFQKLDSVRIKQSAKMADDDFDKVSVAGRKIFREVKENLLNQGDDVNKYFTEAICIYTTIFLNEWFATALLDCVKTGKGVQFGNIAQFVEEVVDLSNYCEDKNRYKGKYSTMRFNLNRNVLRKVLEHEGVESSVRTCITSFCRMVRRDKLSEDAHKSDDDNWDQMSDSGYRTMEFDVLRPIIVQLYNCDVIIHKMEADTEQEATKDKETEGKVRPIRAPYLVTIRNILANYDMQWKMRSIIDEWYNKNNEDKRTLSMVEQLSKMVSAIDEQLEIPKGESEDTIMGIYDMADAKYQNIINVLFLCNKNNFVNYAKEKSEELSACLKSVSAKEDIIDKNLATDDKKRISELRNLTEKALREVESGLNKIWIDESQIDLIAESFGLEDGKEITNLTDAILNLSLSKSGLEADQSILSSIAGDDNKSIIVSREPEQESSTKDTP